MSRFGSVLEAVAGVTKNTDSITRVTTEALDSAVKTADTVRRVGNGGFDAKALDDMIVGLEGGADRPTLPNSVATAQDTALIDKTNAAYSKLAKMGDDELFGGVFRNKPLQTTSTQLEDVAGEAFQRVDPSAITVTGTTKDSTAVYTTAKAEDKTQASIAPVMDVAKIGVGPDGKEEFALSIGTMGRNIRGTGLGEAGYDATYKWAIDNNKRVIADPSGISLQNTIRKGKNIASAILKYGKSDFVQPNKDLFAWVSTEVKNGNDYADLSDFFDTTPDKLDSVLKAWEEAGVAMPRETLEKGIKAGTDAATDLDKYWGKAGIDSPELAQQRANNIFTINLIANDKAFDSKYTTVFKPSKAIRDISTAFKKFLGTDDLTTALVDVNKGGTPKFIEWLKTVKDDPEWQKILPAIVGVEVLNNLTGESDNGGA